MIHHYQEGHETDTPTTPACWPASRRSTKLGKMTRPAHHPAVAERIRRSTPRYQNINPVQQSSRTRRAPTFHCPLRLEPPSRCPLDHALFPKRTRHFRLLRHLARPLMRLLDSWQKAADFRIRELAILDMGTEGVSRVGENLISVLLGCGSRAHLACAFEPGHVLVVVALGYREAAAERAAFARLVIDYLAAKVRACCPSEASLDHLRRIPAWPLVRFDVSDATAAISWGPALAHSWC